MCIEALATCQLSGDLSQRRRTLRGYLDQAAAFLKIVHPQRGSKPRRAGSRQDVIRPGAIIAQRLGSVAPEENCPGMFDLWQELSRFNPFFYMIDGFRYGFFGMSDISPWVSLLVVSGCTAAMTLFTLWLLKSGYKLRH